MLRLFLGVRPGPEILKDLLAIQQGLPGRHVPPENIHLTLKFFGELESDIPVRKRLESARFSSCRQPLDTRLAFPSPRKPQVLAVGCRQANAELAEIWRYFGAEDRGFVPHLTLSRLKAPQPFEEGPLQRVLELSVTQLTLFQSHLGSEGSRYQILQEFPLATLAR